ncbi:MAG: hypothetical protein V1847_00030 [Candidatus Diapherotrites archaeon]
MNPRFEMVKGHHIQKFEEAMEEGKVDPLMRKFCAKIQNSKNYFTTSSCSGRIVLLDLDANEQKREGAFHAKWHRKVKTEEVWKALNAPSKQNIWFKQEPFILHIGTFDLEHAQKILQACKRAGVKRAGINSFKEGKYMVELIGHQGMNFWAKEKGKLLVEKNFLKKQVEAANRKLELNFKHLKRAQKELAKLE